LNFRNTTFDEYDEYQHAHPTQINRMHYFKYKFNTLTWSE